MDKCITLLAKYKLLYYNASDMRSKNLVETNLVDIIDSVKAREYAITMDEVDGMSGGEKGGMAQLIKIIHPSTNNKLNLKRKTNYNNNNNNNNHNSDIWYPPIICISNSIDDSKMDDLKKECEVIKFDQISSNNILKLINRICVNENININEECKMRFTALAQGDFRRAINLLQKYNKNGFIDSKIMDEYLDKVDYIIKKYKHLIFWVFADFFPKSLRG